MKWLFELFEGRQEEQIDLKKINLDRLKEEEAAHKKELDRLKNESAKLEYMLSQVFRFAIWIASILLALFCVSECGDSGPNVLQ